jgi:hypothetical protein
MVGTKEFKGDRARKINQFTTVFHLLQTRHAMLEFKSMNKNSPILEDATSQHQALVIQQWLDD